MRQASALHLPLVEPRERREGPDRDDGQFGAMLATMVSALTLRAQLGPLKDVVAATSSQSTNNRSRVYLTERLRRYPRLERWELRVVDGAHSSPSITA